MKPFCQNVSGIGLLGVDSHLFKLDLSFSGQVIIYNFYAYTNNNQLYVLFRRVVFVTS